MLWVAAAVLIDKCLIKEVRTSRQDKYLGTYLFSMRRAMIEVLQFVSKQENLYEILFHDDFDTDFFLRIHNCRLV